MAQLTAERMKVQSITTQLQSAIANAKLKDVSVKSEMNEIISNLKVQLAECRASGSNKVSEIKRLQDNILELKAALGDKKAQQAKDAASKKKLLIGASIAGALALGLGLN